MNAKPWLNNRIQAAALMPVMEWRLDSAAPDA
jgi:hypothetical protein